MTTDSASTNWPPAAITTNNTSTCACTCHATNTTNSSLPSRFTTDDELWRTAPLLTGAGSFDPLPSVRNILVTGGEGFIASWLLRHLTHHYPTYNLISLDTRTYCSSPHNTRQLLSHPNFTFVHADLTSESAVLSVLREYDVDTIFHLAAMTHVDLSFGNAFAFTRNNVLGTHILLEGARAVGTVKRFYHVSTDEVYGEVGKEQADLLEHSLLEPTNPYAATKACAEMLVTAYAKSFKLPVVIIRLNNIYGQHQFPEKIIPKFTSLLQRNLPLFLHGDGLHTRRYLHAADAADAFDTILHKGTLGEIYNVDSRDELSNLDLAKKLLGIFGIEETGEWIRWTRDRPFNDRRYAVDGSKLRALGWRQRVGFEEGLRETVRWYGEFAGWWGEVDSTLMAPFPVVKEGEVVGSPGREEVEVVEEGMVDGDVVVGADGCGDVVAVGANGKGDTAVSVTGGADAAVNGNGVDGAAVSANGVDAASSKKRKVERMA